VKRPFDVCLKRSLYEKYSIVVAPIGFELQAVLGTEAVQSDNFDISFSTRRHPTLELPRPQSAVFEITQINDSLAHNASLV